MEQKINRYVKGHMMTIMIVILISFLFLFLGEFFLYRKIRAGGPRPYDVSQHLARSSVISNINPPKISTSYTVMP